MRTKKALGWLLAVSFGALAAPSIIGCGGVVQVGGGSGGDGAGGSGEDDDGVGGGLSDPGAGGSGGAAPQAIAMTYAQLEAAGTGSTGSGTTSTAGGGPDPATQYLKFGGGTEAPACSAPYGNGLCGGWSASISIAPYLFEPGVIPFSHPDLDLFVEESIDEGNGQCSGGGGGGFDDGQLEIVEITPTTVSFVVSGVTSFFSEDPNGARVAARCP